LRVLGADDDVEQTLAVSVFGGVMVWECLLSLEPCAALSRASELRESSCAKSKEVM
jgi:hypothetical protein